MTNKPMLSVELELLELVTDNKHIDKESICIRRWEALCKLRAILNKPAGQHQGDPVALQHMAVSEGGVLRWMTGRKMQDCELYAMPDGSAIRSKLYAEQPAPVAVVMPERKRTHPSNPLHAEAMQYNAALDDVTRLNGVKP